MSQPPVEIFRFRLYVAGDTQNSIQALANLKKFCQVYLPDSHEIEVLDVFQESCQTLEDGIFMTPTLVKLSPFPMIKIVGTLNQSNIILQALGLDTLAL
ncbi:MAG: circadian clock KaiB family protein [Pseudomonadota bacterium]